MSPALYGRASARAPSHSYFLAKLVFFAVTFFLELLLFSDCAIRSVGSFARVKPTMSDEILDDTIISFEYRISYLRPFVISHPAERSQLSINSACRDEF